MNNSVKIYTLACLAFIVLLSVSGSMGGIIGEVVYYLSFLLPFLLCFLTSRRAQREREEVKGVAEKPRHLFSINSEGAVGTLLLIAPTVSIVMLLSYLTSLLLSMAGATDTPVPDAPLFLMLLEHAIIPPLLEEMLFRYIPLLLIAPYSRRWCVIVSAVYFALIHCNLFQIPYALIAGAIFMLIDLAFDSVLPSLILHLCNNIASIIFMKLCLSPTGQIIYFSVLGGLTVLSVSLLIAFHSRLYKRLVECLDKGESFSTRSPLALILLSLGVAILNLF